MANPPSDYYKVHMSGPDADGRVVAWGRRRMGKTWEIQQLQRLMALEERMRVAKENNDQATLNELLRVYLAIAEELEAHVAASRSSSSPRSQ